MRTELRVVNIDDDGAEEVIDGITLDMTPSQRLVAEWGVEYPEHEEDFHGYYPVTVPYQGPAYLRLNIFARLIPDPETGRTFTIRRGEPPLTDP